IFWAYFLGAPRKTGLILLFGDPTADYKDITKEVYYLPYLRTRMLFFNIIIYRYILYISSKSSSAS
ncbi:uncharacterized protein N7443_004291, partial [Penicillium atrosanguineum]